MPSSYLHYSFARDFETDDFFTDKEMILLGAQGADILFFYGKIYFWRNKKITKSGNDFHEKKISETFIEMIRFAQSLDSKDQKIDFFSYIYGYFMHYILDRKIHPYVYYYSFPNEQKNLFVSDHILLETYMDMKLSDINHEEIDFPKILKTSEGAVKRVSSLYSHLNSTLHKNSFLKAYQEMLLIRKLTHKRFYLKRIMNAIGLKNSGLNHAIFPELFADEEDVLNLNRETYANPETGALYNESVLDLMKSCRIEVNYIRNLLTKYYLNDHDFSHIYNFVGNQDFNGIDLKRSKYFESKFFESRNR